MDKGKIGHKLVSWYKKFHRQLPWRQTSDPYKIWLSEIILQQTRVAQGYPYYIKFVDRFPDVGSLAKASEKEVLSLWQGLGYYSRARNMHATARIIVEKFGGKFPDNYADLIQLKGIGDYTASAIASFAFDEQTAVVDGNVFRVLARYYGIASDISTGGARKVFKEAAYASMPPAQAAMFNQAIMEFGALQCVPVSPDCGQCILNESCFAYQNKAQNIYPVKTKKNKIRQRTIHYLVIRYEKKIAMRERVGKDIWQGLFDFHSSENDSSEPPTDLFPAGWKHSVPAYSAGPVRHILSHQHLTLHYWLLDLYEWVPLPDDLNWYTEKEIVDLPKPLPINIYLKDFL